MVDSIVKLLPLVTVAGGAAASSPNVKQQLEKLFDTVRISAAQSEVNNIAQMVYLETFENTQPTPAEFADYVRAHMKNKKGNRDTSIDNWGTPYGLAYDTTNKKLYVICAGPDKKYNTEDDIYATYSY